MDFTAELATFPSQVHKNIYIAARGMTPLNRSLSDMPAGELRDSCVALNAFALDMLGNMYDCPEAWHLPVHALEKHLGGLKVNTMKRKEPGETQALLSQTRNAVCGYQTLLCLLGQHGVLSGNALCVSPEDMADLAKRAAASSSPIPLPLRLEALARVGLRMQGEGCFVSEKHPGIFPALVVLAQSAEKLSSFGFFAFRNLEFRNIGSKYKPVYEDYMSPLIKERKAISAIIDGHAKLLRLRPQCNTYWKVEYKYRGKQVMTIDTSDGDLLIRITSLYHWDDLAVLTSRLDALDPVRRRTLDRHMSRCTACSTSHEGGRFVQIFGRTQRVCGAFGFHWLNPSQEDLDDIRFALAMRCEIIDAIHSDEKKRKPGSA